MVILFVLIYKAGSRVGLFHWPWQPHTYTVNIQYKVKIYSNVSWYSLYYYLKSHEGIWKTSSIWPDIPRVTPYTTRRSRVVYGVTRGISAKYPEGIARGIFWRYQTRKSSRVKYPTHPEGPTSRGTREAAPRDVWDISRGMISEFDIGHILRVFHTPEWAFICTPQLWYIKGNKLKDWMGCSSIM